MYTNSISVRIYLFLFFILFLSSNNVFSQAKTLGLTKHFNGGQENGYVLFSPIGSDTTFLINKCGQKVHTWYSPYTPGLSVYLLPNGHLLKTGNLSGATFGGAGGKGGVIEEFDWDGKLVWRYVVSNDSLCQHHDITPMPNGNILILAWHTISRAEAIALGRDSLSFGGKNDLWGERIIELKPLGADSGKIVWQWDLFDHIVQNTDISLPNYGIINQHPELMNINYTGSSFTNDWIHANSLDYNKDLDQIVISCHSISEIWIIDHGITTAQAVSHAGGRYGKGGDILYRWGNPEAYDKGSKNDRKLFKQHNAYWIPKGQKDSGSIMLFNNGLGRDTAYSTVDIIKTPVNTVGAYSSSLPYAPTNQNWIYKDSIPTNFSSHIISGAQRLPNGNTLICSGVQGKFFEVTQQKKVVWEYKSPVRKTGHQTDGEAPGNNAVFRCTFYPNNYSAFSNRTLKSLGTIEKKSYPYSCNYETTPPKVVSLNPKHNEISVGPTPTLQIIFNESVLKKTGNILVFQNNSLLETIAIDSSSVQISNNVVTIYQKEPFKTNSVISILIPSNSFRDSSNNLTKSIDTSAWHFYTERPQLEIVSLFPENLAENVHPSSKLTILFKDSIYKSADGNIRIYENSVLKEQIPVASNKIAVKGQLVTISPTLNFALDASISIETDTCFKNSKGVFSPPVVQGVWSFKILPSPKVISLTPAKGANNILLNPTLSIGFDRNITVGNSGSLMVYMDGFLFDIISITGPRTMISGNSINFDLNTDLLEGSRIGIQLNADLLKDSAGAFFKGIDSSEWYFNTLINNSAISNSYKIRGYYIYPNPGNGNFILNADKIIESIEIFDFTGKHMEFYPTRLNDNKYEINLNNPAPGHYMILVNGTNAMHLLIE